MNEYSKPLHKQKFAVVDLETTGLRAETDRIIEVGIQVFTLDGPEESFSTLVNPKKKLTSFVTHLTGIEQADVEVAPMFSEIQTEIDKFITNKVIVGHNIDFDLNFLAKQGLTWNQPKIDTLSLAYCLDYDSPDYKLETLMRRHGISQDQKHRALDDCVGTMKLFQILIEKMTDLEPVTLSRLYSISQKAGWDSAFILGELNQTGNLFAEPRRDTKKTPIHQKPLVPISRVKKKNEVEENNSVVTLNQIFGPSGRLSETIDSFEDRPDQLSMAIQISGAMDNNECMFIEAGTGTGKSLAYLVPALLSASQKDMTTIISTNTLNLQEQLLDNDLPVALKCMETKSQPLMNSTKITVLKGRSNYLCKRRLENYLDRPTLTFEESMLLGKLLVWSEYTTTGDKSEISITRSSHNGMWRKLSAEGAGNCEFYDQCFLKTARDKAASAKVVITNHSLLFANIASGSSILPAYDHLIIDEAHHLEEQATNSFGYEIKLSNLNEIFEELNNSNGIILTNLKLLKGFIDSQDTMSVITSIESELKTVSARGKDTLKTLHYLLRKVINSPNHFPQVQEKAVDNLRTSPDWEQLELTTENLHIHLQQLIRFGNKVISISEPYFDHVLIRNMRLDIDGWRDEITYLNEKLYESIFEPQNNAVYWIQYLQSGNSVAIKMAPLDVSSTVKDHFFNDDSSVIMTSATLRTSGNFDYIQKRLGGEEIQSEVIESPFDYLHSTVCIEVEDTGDPREPDYLENVSIAIADAAIAAGGRTLGLFTSHSALQAVHRKISNLLEGSGITVLSQGVSGSPKDLLDRLKIDHRSVILGTSSMWEGVDVRGDALQVVAITRLPFGVPSDPVFKARSEQYENPFMEYALPDAILRFRQGFGRLIRSHSDRGVFLILDSRTSKTRYGSEFLKALPEMKKQRVGKGQIRDLVSRWLKTKT